MSVGVVSSKPLFRLFDPRSAPRCALWYDAADASTITLSSGSNIGQWSSKGNVLATLSQPTAANQPTYVSVNGLSAVAFDGARQCFMQTPCNLSAFTLLDTVCNIAQQSIPYGNMTAFVVTTLSQPSTPMNVVTGQSFGSTATFARFQALSSNNEFLIAAMATPLSMTFSTMTYNTPTVLTVLISGTTVSQCFVNGSLQTTTNSGSIGRPGRTTVYSMIVGDCNASSNLSGYIHEILFYNQALTTYTRTVVENYLFWKWNMIANVSANPITFYRAPPQQTLKDYYPLILQQPLLWLDAADRRSVTVDSNNRLIKWDSKYSSVINASASVSESIGTAPVYSNMNNGMPAFSFTATSSQGMLVTLAPQSFGNSGVTQCFVMQLPSNFSVTQTYLNYQGSNAFAARLLNRTASGTLVFTGGTAASNSISTNNFGVPIIVSIAENGPVNEAKNLYVNGALGNFVGAGSGSNSTISTLFFGGSFVPFVSTGSATNFSTLQLGEWLIFSGPLSRNDRELVEGYLAAKWGATISSGSSLNSSFAGGFTVTTGVAPHPYYRRVGNPLPMLGPSLYTPDMFSNLVLWLDAADRNTLSRDSNNLIVQWLDKSICGNHITATVGTNPTWIETSSLGNLPVLRNVSGASTGSFSGRTAMFVVNLYNATPTDGTSQFRSAANSLRMFQGSLSLSGVHQLSNSATNLSFENSNRVPTLHTVNSTAGTAYYVNGTLIGLNGSAPTGTNTFQFSNAATSLDYGEVIIYTANMTPWIQSQIEGYLAWKWGLRSYLPSNHPYYLKAP